MNEPYEMLRGAPFVLRGYNTDGVCVYTRADQYVMYTDNYLEDLIEIAWYENNTIVRVTIDIALNIGRQE